MSRDEAEHALKHATRKHTKAKSPRENGECCTFCCCCDFTSIAHSHGSGLHCVRLQYLGNPQPHGLSAKRRTLRTHHTARPATADESGAAGHRVGVDVCLSNPILCAGTPGRGGGGGGRGGRTVHSSCVCARKRLQTLWPCTVCAAHEGERVDTGVPAGTAVTPVAGTGDATTVTGTAAAIGIGVDVRGACASAMPLGCAVEPRIRAHWRRRA